MRPETLAARRRLYLLARVVIARHYRRGLTVEAVARALNCSTRQLQRSFAQFSHSSFSEELTARRMTVAAQLLVDQRSLPIDHVARLVGYTNGSHLAGAFRRRYGLTPARYRERAFQAEERS